MLLEKDSTKVIVFPEKHEISSAFGDINPQFSKPGSALTTFCINQTKRPRACIMMNTGRSQIILTPDEHDQHGEVNSTYTQKIMLKCGRVIGTTFQLLDY